MGTQALQISQTHAAEAARLLAEVEQLKARGQAQAQVVEAIGARSESPLREEFGGGGTAWPPRVEPVQIHPGTLRSLSSNSLASLGEDDEGSTRAGAIDIAPPDGTLPQDVMRALSKPTTPPKKTPLEPAHVHVSGCFPGQLRSIRSASGRLDALAEDPRELAETPAHRVLLPRGIIASPLFVPVSSPKLMQTNSPDISVLQTPPPDISSEMGAAAGLSDIDRQAGWSHWGEDLTESVMAAPAPLRMVRTAAGRLDLMASTL